MTSGIKKLEEKGITSYHDTLSYFILHMTHYHIALTPGSLFFSFFFSYHCLPPSYRIDLSHFNIIWLLDCTTFAEFISLRENQELLDLTLHQNYFSEQALSNPKAAEEVILPDLCPLPSITSYRYDPLFIIKNIYIFHASIVCKKKRAEKEKKRYEKRSRMKEFDNIDYATPLFNHLCMNMTHKERPFN